MPKTCPDVCFVSDLTQFEPPSLLGCIEVTCVFAMFFLAVVAHSSAQERLHHSYGECRGAAAQRERERASLLWALCRVKVLGFPHRGPLRWFNSGNRTLGTHATRSLSYTQSHTHTHGSSSFLASPLSLSAQLSSVKSIDRRSASLHLSI